MSYNTITMFQVYAACDPTQTSVNLGDCLLLGEGQASVASLYQNPAQLVSVIVSNLFVLSGVILFLTIFYSGFKFIQDGTKGKDEAKTILTTAAIGFIIMFVAYWVVQIIELAIGQEILF